MNRAGGKREVASMAWPLAVGMLSFTLMGVVDTLLMGHVGTAAQAGVGLAAVLAYACLAFFRGLTTGAQSVVAAAHGAGNQDRVDRAGGAGILLGLGSGFVALGLLLAVYPLVLGFAVPDPEVAASASSYLQVRAWGLPCSLLSFGFLAGLQGLGDTKSRMWVSVAGNLLNVSLDLVLIFGCGPVPALGETGAAVATVASAALMALLYGVRFWQRFGSPRLPGRKVLRSACALGVPAGCQSLSGVFAFLVMNLVLAQAGAAHVAASMVVLNVVSLSFLPGVGVGEAAGVLVGRYLGAGQRESAARTVRSARALAMLVMGLCGVVFATQGEHVAWLFTRDEEVAKLVGTLFLFAASFQLFDAVATVHLCVLRGAGDTRFTLVATAGASWGLLVPLTLALGLGMGWGAPGAWLGLTVEVAALAALTGWRVTGLDRGTVGRLDLLLGA